MTMYDIIKTQWDEGCYSKASDLDVYVEAGWITKDQENQITGVGKNTLSDKTVTN